MLIYRLCNACGLQYAKTIKKQKKDKDRKDQDLQMNVSILTISK